MSKKFALHIMLFSGTLLLFFSCNSINLDTNKRFLKLKKENLILKKEIDTLKKQIKGEVFTPIVFNNTYGRISTNIKPEFMVSLAYKRPGLIDSIRCILYKMTVNDEKIKINDIQREYLIKKHNSSINTFKFNRLTKGKYLIRGYYRMFINDKVKKLYFAYDFTVPTSSQKSIAGTKLVSSEVQYLIKNNYKINHGSQKISTDN